MFALLLLLPLAALAVVAGKSAPPSRPAPPLPPGPVDANGFRIFGLATPELLVASAQATQAGYWLIVDLVDGGGNVWRTIVWSLPAAGSTAFIGAPYQAPSVAPTRYPFTADEVAAIVGVVPQPTKTGA